jgi:hypothetical protein
LSPEEEIHEQKTTTNRKSRGIVTLSGQLSIIVKVKLLVHPASQLLHCTVYSPDDSKHSSVKLFYDGDFFSRQKHLT